MKNSMDSIPGNTGHGGNIHLLSRKISTARPILDFSANINPLGPPSWLRRVISRSLADIVHYPDPDSYEFVRAASNQVARAGNGRATKQMRASVLQTLASVFAVLVRTRRSRAVGSSK